MSYRSNNFSGTIPRNIGLNPSLTHLDFGDNKLTGTIPHELSRLGLLTVLKLGVNKLTGTLPSSLSQFQRLSFFVSENNALRFRCNLKVSNICLSGTNHILFLYFQYYRTYLIIVLRAQYQKTLV